MNLSPIPEMPLEFIKSVHQALKAWHKFKAIAALDNLLLAQDIQAAHETWTPQRVRNQLLLEGLECLKLEDAKASELLARRFIDLEMAQEIASRWNVTRNVIYQRQQRAMTMLTKLIWKQELAHRQQHAERVQIRALTSATHAQLFGLDDKITTLSKQIAEMAGPWIFALEGIGGSGKTTLADALTRVLAQALCFSHFIWINASPASASSFCRLATFETFIEECVEQLELNFAKTQSLPKKVKTVQNYLKERPSLIVIDDLEATSEQRTLITQLRELTAPSKLLVTTRQSLRGENGVRSIAVEGLNCEDTLALVRSEAEYQGLDALAHAPDAVLRPIYAVTGGNPRAIQLAIAQTHFLPLSVVLEQFRQGKGQSIQALLSNIYTEIYQSLSANCYPLLAALAQMDVPVEKLDQLAALAQLSQAEIGECIIELTRHSLIDIKGDLHAKTYSLHPLSRSFIRAQGPHVARPERNTA